jgi:hypothetical protein
VGLISRLFSSQQKTPAEFTPEWVAEKLASSLAKEYSPAGFSRWFGNQKLAEGHTLNDALAAWYSLANLQLVIAAWAAFKDGEKADCIIDLTRVALQRHWSLPNDALEKLRTIVEKTEAFSVAAYSSCGSGMDLHRFFDQYIWMILGGPLISESANKERTGSRDLASEVALCQLFLDSLAADKKFLVEWGDAVTRQSPNWWRAR